MPRASLRMTTNDARPSRPPTAASPVARALSVALSLALIVGVGLALARALALYVKFRVLRGDALEPTLSRIAFTLGYAVPFAVALAAAAVAILVWSLRPA